MSDPLLEGERTPVFVVGAVLTKNVQDLHPKFVADIIGMEADVLIRVIDGKNLGVYVHDGEHNAYPCQSTPSS